MKPFFLVAAVSLASAVHAAPRIFLQSLPQTNAANPPKGYVVAQRANGRFVRISQTNNCWNLKASPDGKSWAWIEGEFVEQDRDAQTIFARRILVWRNGETANTRATIIRPIKAYEVMFRWNDATHLAVGSRGRHGATHLELFEARSGRRLAHHEDYETKLPAWAKSVEEF
ncbi:MAG TPA: hypothetical protein VF681_11845 [Abditibacteriaceae bacterium]|jgi:hypothetical protein